MTILLLVGGCKVASAQSNETSAEALPPGAEASTQAGSTGSTEFTIGELPPVMEKRSGEAGDDTFLPEILLKEEIIQGIEAGEMSAPRPPPPVNGVPRAHGIGELGGGRTVESGESGAEGEVLENIRLQGQFAPQAAEVGFLDAARPRAMAQAVSTGEVILANLSGVRGAVASPFLSLPHRKAPALRIGSIHFYPHLSIGVAATHSSGSGTEGDGEEIGGFFQAGFVANFKRTENFAGTLTYTIGDLPSTQGGEDGIDQHFLLGTEFSFPQWTKLQFALGFEYVALGSINRDVGEQTELVLATATAGVSYAYSQKTSFDFDISVPVREFSDGVSSGGVTTSLFITNKVTKKTQLGLGISAGTLEVEGGSTQTFEQLLLQGHFQPSDLLSFKGTAGLELRQVDGTSYLHPVFRLGATWNPRLGTSVVLAAESRIFNSATSENTNFRSTGVTLSVIQRIGYRFIASLSLGYENARYDSAGVGSQTKRNDHLLNASLGLNLVLTQRWSCGLTLSVGENISNVSPFEFRQAVLQTSYSF